MRQLYYGDNLDVMKRHIKEESVDLVYLDPPFKSNRDYNVLFKEKDGAGATSQIKAFEDTWSWGQDDLLIYEELIVDPDIPQRLRSTLVAMYAFLGGSDMMSYVVMMAPRLIQLRRVMKSTASIYLHCDCSASHYLKMLMDGVFGPENFRNEIVWQRTLAKALTSRQLPNNHDIIFCYQKTNEATWNADAMFQAYDESALDEKTSSKYRLRDQDGRLYQLDNLINPNPDRPNLTYEFLGVTKVWRWTKQRMQAAFDAGLVVQPRPGGVPRYKRYLDKQRGRPLGDVWIDIPPINSQAQERLGYPTQKPLALLERVIKASSNQGDIVLDPFCGCGTAIHAAEKLGRGWVGIDITQLSITLMKERLSGAFGLIPLTKEHRGADNEKTYRIKGEPTSLAEALQLKEDDPHQFEYWALGLIKARPAEEKKGADRGIDGKLFFVGDNNKALETIIISVKSGHVKRQYMHELRGVIDREKAVIGVLITLEKPTKNMMEEVLLGGFYESATWGKKYPRLQILTIEEIMNGKGIDMPPINQTNATFIKTKKEQEKGTTKKQRKLPM